MSTLNTMRAEIMSIKRSEGISPTPYSSNSLNGTLSSMGDFTDFVPLKKCDWN